MTVLREVKRPNGFNQGMNTGTNAGAGIAGHAHLHVVPRWDGDANFLPDRRADQGAARAARHHPRAAGHRLAGGE